MPDRSIWVCPSRYRRLSTASVARLLRQNSKPAIADNALFPRLFRASQVYICRKTFGYLLRPCGRISARSVRRQTPQSGKALGRFLAAHCDPAPARRSIACARANSCWQGHAEAIAITIRRCVDGARIGGDLGVAGRLRPAQFQPIQRALARERCAIAAAGLEL